MKDLISQIKDYIGIDYGKVPYLYSNLSVYSPENPSVKAWIEKDKVGEIIAVFLLYHTSLHFYCRQERYIGSMLCELMSQYAINTVMLPHDKVELLSCFPSSDWNYDTDYILLLQNELSNPNYSSLLVKSEDEISDIVRLLMQDPLYSNSYTIDQLESQLKERWRAGYGKIFRYRESGKVVGCIAITGESDRFIFTGCLMVDPAHRREGVANELVKACNSYSYTINKDRLCFVGVENKASMKLHEKYAKPTVVGKIIKCHRKIANR